jgi:hypothetical protein
MRECDVTATPSEVSIPHPLASPDVIWIPGGDRRRVTPNPSMRLPATSGFDASPERGEAFHE